MPQSPLSRRRTALAAERLEDRVNPVSFTGGDWGYTGSNSMTVAFGEINGDGKIDMAVGTASTGVELHLNDGHGDFTWLNNITGMGFPEQMELPDLTGDGLADILTGLSFAQWVAAIPNNGDGTFGAPILKDIGVNVQDVDAADFNGDGKLDVVAAVPGGAAVLFNTGDATLLGSPTIYNHNSSGGGAWVTVGDFNNDAKPDFAVSVHLLRRIDVYLNDGTGVFTRNAFANPVANDSGDVISGDFNNDGNLDIVTGYYLTGMLGLMRGLGDGNFLTATITHSSASRVGPLAAADFDLDGNLDILTMHGPDKEELVLPGNGDGTFAAAVGTGQVGFPGDVAVADVNGDVLPDIATSQALSGGNFNISLNTSPVSFSFRISAPAGTLAGDEFSITVIARDHTGVVLTGYTGTVHFSSSDSGALLPANYQFTSNDAGIATFTVTLFDAGLQRIMVADTARPDMDGIASVAVQPGAFSRFELVAPSSADAGEPFNVTVTARDEFGNRVPFNGAIHFSSTDPAAQLPPDSTLSSGLGVFPVTLFAAGNQTVTVADAANSSVTSSAVVSVSAGTTLEMTAPEEAEVGVPFDVTITARDKSGNIATGYDGTLHFTSTDLAALLPDDATLTEGLGTFSVTLMTDGTWTITATDEIAGIFAQSAPITATAPSSVRSIIADFGTRGLRRWTEADGWVVISPFNADRAILSADGSTVVADFGNRGLRLWTEPDEWLSLTPANVEKAVISADGSTVVADFGNGGLRRWSSADGWTKLAKANSQNVFLSADGSTVVADFGFGGVRRWTETGGWVTASDANPIRIAADVACETVVADFGVIGLWRWTAADDRWVQLSRQTVLRVAISADGSTVVADFNNRGLQLWTESSGWVKLSPLNAERVSISPDGQDVVADFGSRGLRRWSASGSGVVLTQANVQDVLLSPTSPALIADFGAGGLKLYTTAWTTLTGLDPEQILIV